MRLCRTRQEGISHVQAWIDPSNLRGLDWFAGVLEALDRG